MAATNDTNPSPETPQPRKTPARLQKQDKPAILNAAPRPETLICCLRRRLVLAVSVGLLLAVVAGAGVWVGMPEPKHTVRTRLRVPPGYSVVRNGPVLDHQQHQRNEVALAKSAVVLSAALRDPAVAKLVGTVIVDTIEPVVWLEQNVQVDFSIAPEIMQISMAGTRTDELKVLVGAIREAYLTEVVERDRSVRQQRLAFLGEWIQKCEDRLKIARETQQAAIEQVGGKNPLLRAHAIGFAKQVLEATERELHAAKGDLRKAKEILTTLEAKAAKPETLKVPEAEILAEVNKDPEIGALRKRIQDLKTQEETIRLRAAPARVEEEVAFVRRKLALANEEMKIVIDRLREQKTQNAQERAVGEFQAALRSQVGRVASLEQNVANLEADRKVQTEQLAKVGKQGDQVEVAFDSVKHFEKLRDQFTLDKAALEVDLDAPNRIATLEDVTVQRVDARTRRLMMAAGAALGGLCFALFGVAWLEYRTRRVETVDDVVLGLGFRLVGTVPNTPRKARNQVGPGGKKGSLSQIHLESVDAVRTTLLHLIRAQTVRTVLVTSAVAGEGKTTLSCHLAASLARAGLKTLLIDGDGRNPNVHKLFRIGNEVGFGEVLCGECPPEKAIHPTPVKGFAVMPAGVWSDKVLLAINQGRVAELLQHLRQDFDLILLDSSPVLPVADAQVIGQQVDGVLLSVLCQVTQLTNLYAASHRLDELGTNMLGVVISGVQVNLYGSSIRYPYPRQANAQPQGAEKGGQA